MSPRDWTLRVKDMIQAIDRIEQYTNGLTFETFQADQKTVDAVLLNLQLIGEAARHVPDDIALRHPQIPWADIRGARNVLVHEYFGVSLPIIWDTVQRSLPPLRLALSAMLE